MLEVARLLLARGADPDTGYLWEGLPSPFTALTGAFGEGEGGPPPHQHRLRLARLLLEAGADPNDAQTMYNCGPVGHRGDDTSHLELLFEFGLGRASGGPWAARLGHTLPSPAQLLEDELRCDAERNLPRRARLVLSHGVDVDGLGTDHRMQEGYTARELAVLGGHTEIAGMLAAAGARPPDRVTAFLGACARADRRETGRLSAASPGIAGRAIARRPHHICKAAGQGNLDAVRLMAGIGFDVNVMRRNAALHEAAFNGDLPMVRLLLELGADPALRDPSYDSTPRGWAEYNGKRAAAGYLAAAESKEPASGQ